MRIIPIKYSKYPLKYDYYVTEDGHIYSLKSDKLLKEHFDKDGYKKVRLCSVDKEYGRHTYSVHRLVMENFMPVENMHELQINHIDGDKTNNSLSNLEWCTCKENIRHAVQNNLRARVNGSAKLTIPQVIEIYNRCQTESLVNIAKDYGVVADTISKIKHKKMWKRIIDEYINEGSTTIA